MLLAFVLWVLIGVGVGALVRNQVGAIVGVLVFTQFLEPVGRAAAAFVEGSRTSRDSCPAPRATRSSARASSHGHGATGARRRAARVVGRAVSCCSATRVVLVVLGHLLSWRRDVS